MNRKFTIEIDVDYADNEKNEAMRIAVARAARHVWATACLLADGVTPQAAAWSNDFYHGMDQIKLLEDYIQEGIDSGGIGEDEGVSSELLAAVAPLMLTGPKD